MMYTSTTSRLSTSRATCATNATKVAAMKMVMVSLHLESRQPVGEDGAVPLQVEAYTDAYTVHVGVTIDCAAAMVRCAS